MKKKKHVMNIETYENVIIILLISLTPLLVRINITETPLSNLSWHSNDPNYFDIFTLVKSQFVLLLGIISSFIVIYKQIKFKVLNIKDPVILLILSLATIIIISHFYSMNQELSGSGAPGRYEGVWIWLSYLSLFTMVYYKNWTKESTNYVFKFFLVTNFILSIIGLLQYFGIDVIINDFTKSFITSSNLRNLDFTTYSKINYKVIIQTLDHYNYVGYYISLSLPFVLTIFTHEKDHKFKAVYLVLLGMMFFNLIGSSARGGLVGIIVSLLFFIFLNKEKIFKNIKIAFVALTLLIITFISIELYSGGFFISRLQSIFTTLDTIKTIEEINLSDNTITFRLAKGDFKVEVDTENKSQWLTNYYFNDSIIEPIVDASNSKITFDRPELNRISTSLSKYGDSILLVIETYGEKWHFGYDSSGTLSYINLVGKPDMIIKPESLGFTNSERMGSGRGYIWSRSIPLILDKPLIGYGPDTFVAVFPQQDYVGKYNTYGTTNMTVDKAHNVYIQLAMNSGLGALIIYLLLLILSFKRSIKYIQLNGSTNQKYKLALLTSIISFIVASLFNDSTLQVSPLFWFMIGYLLNDDSWSLNLK